MKTPLLLLLRAYKLESAPISGRIVVSIPAVLITPQKPFAATAHGKAACLPANACASAIPGIPADSIPSPSRQLQILPLLL